MINITTVRFGEEEEREVLDTLRSGIVAQGPKVARLESRFAELFGVRHVVAVNNGTTALVAALEVLDLEPGDEVLTSPFTFVATLNAILESGATATFADIREEDFALDPSSVEAAVGDRTRALLPVHLYGQLADMTALGDIAGRHGLRVVEDAAQSHGATLDGRYAGSFGDLATFSLYATKNITSGEGGLIATDDDVLADRLRVLRNQGMRERYVYEVAGHNYRLTDLQAALALPQLERYERTVAMRERNAARLRELLADVPGIATPVTLPGRRHVWHQFTVRVTDEAPVDREAFVARLRELGVESGIYYPRLLPDYDAYREHPRVIRSETPVAERVARQVVSLPVHTELSDDDLKHIGEAVATAVAR